MEVSIKITKAIEKIDKELACYSDKKGEEYYKMKMSRDILSSVAKSLDSYDMMDTVPDVTHTKYWQMPARMLKSHVEDMAEEIALDVATTLIEIINGTDSVNVEK
ncbi:hypothetical protein [uncultured Methanobrevibacter sp.]|uniref:hypothetical protein n=1 Tax=uncultured Methanobrevibacter sp. TaxID=253161 RepID=UPI0025F2BA9A|nr:hypothetical protein [uncultured Methanobrevibacter sp.]